MALTSPGTQLTVTDESQYVPGAVGTVPLVVLATAQDKIFNGAVATGTTKANAGVLQSIGSQRELVSAFGYPYFEQSAAGTPLHGSERNEYGLMAAYSALGLGNRIFAIRADIDIDQLEKTAVRPTGMPVNGAMWLDLENTRWGIFEWDAETSTFSNQLPLLITKTDEVDNTGTYPAPLQSIGIIGQYAVVTTDTNNYTYIKNTQNIWVLLGSTDWQNSFPAVTGTVSEGVSPILDNSGYQISINGTAITLTGDTLTSVVTDINDIFGTGTGIIAGTDAATQSKLVFYVNRLSESDGTTADGIMDIQDISSGTLDQLGITAGLYYSPIVEYGSYVNVPAFRSTDAEPRPTNSIWLKTSATGNGASWALKEYNAASETFVSVAAPLYQDEANALYGLDPVGGGLNITVGTYFVQYSVLGDNVNPLSVTMRAMVRGRAGETKIVGTVATPAFTSSHQVEFIVTLPGSNQGSSAYTVTVGGTGTASDFVTSILAANIPNLTAAVESTGAVSITHTRGGTFFVRDVGVGTALLNAGIIGAAYVRVDTAENSDYYICSNWKFATITSSMNRPSTLPDDGTLWYYGDAATVDILINNGGPNGWRGYRTAGTDSRGYDLSQTDPLGVIVAATKPEYQNDTVTPVAPGDIWLDSSDLENYPSLYRYTGTSWASIDNTDSVNQNGIVFADARWANSGSVNPISDDLPPIKDLLSSNYVDLDIIDSRLYPRGILLFNTRRSGYNVKQFVQNKFTETNYPNVSLPSNKSAWVTVSGNKNDGSPYAGHYAQRHMIVKALKAAIAANTDIREDRFSFSLICAPGYPELISDMVSLNNDRKNTAFVIGDTPMTLPANSVQITNWSNGVDGIYGDGLVTADPYLGVFYPSAMTTDVQGNDIVVPPSHMMLRTFIRSDNVSYQWFAPAGTRRGLIDNATGIGYLSFTGTTSTFIETGVNSALRDSMYITAVNPITVLPGVGLVAWGQKTRQPTSAPSAMDRINVARLINYIRTILANVGNGFLFEPNDKITRDQIKQIIEGAMNDLVAKRGLYDYLVVCDTSNNTPERIARNELYVDIAIAPMKSVEFIYVPIRIKNPGDIAAIK